MSSSKDCRVVLKSSIKGLTSTFKLTTLFSMNLSLVSNKFLYTFISPIICSTYEATWPSSLGYSPNDSFYGVLICTLISHPTHCVNGIALFLVIFFSYFLPLYHLYHTVLMFNSIFVLSS